MTTTDETPDAAKHVAECDTWTWFGRRFNTPKWNTISCNCQKAGNTGHFELASKVFAGLKLDTTQLAEIFSEGTGAIPADYDRLGFCGAGSVEKWAALATLTQKTIKFVLCDEEPQGVWVFTCYPNGSIVYTSKE